MCEFRHVKFTGTVSGVKAEDDTNSFHYSVQNQN